MFVFSREASTRHVSSVNVTIASAPVNGMLVVEKHFASFLFYELLRRFLSEITKTFFFVGICVFYALEVCWELLLGF